MLFKSRILSLIKEGKVNTAYRKWKRPTVKAGGTLMTAIGQLRIDSVEVIREENLASQNFEKAGYSDYQSLFKDLSKKDHGLIYKIKFRLEREDPRIALRNKSFFETNELEELEEKLARLDRGSKYGPWTYEVLKIISVNPGQRAQDLADELKVEKDWLKVNIRKLKNLGLTISLETGYEISPRGLFLMEKLSKS